MDIQLFGPKTLKFSVIAGNPDFQLEGSMNEHHHELQTTSPQLWMGKGKIAVIHGVRNSFALELVIWQLLFQFRPQAAKETDKFLIASLKIGGFQELFISAKEFTINRHV